MTSDLPIAKGGVLFVAKPSGYGVPPGAGTQAQLPAENNYLSNDDVAKLVDTDAAFGVTTRRVVCGGLTLYPRHNRLIGRIGGPRYSPSGNHDPSFLATDENQ